ncbi:MAG: FYVE zinc finger domain-containing protein [Sulfobacillus sp.]
MSLDSKGMDHGSQVREASEFVSGTVQRACSAPISTGRPRPIDIQGEIFTPPSEDHLQKYLADFYPKPNEEWVNASSVLRCQNCAGSFGMFVRKHHCRACGCVFCSNCCHQYIAIPNELIRSPLASQALRVKVTSLIHWMRNGSKSLVCNSCYDKIERLQKIESLIIICQALGLRELQAIACVSKTWHQVAVFYLSKFRRLQYLSNDGTFDDWEVKALWQNRQLLVGHHHWTVCLIKSVIWDCVVGATPECQPAGDASHVEVLAAEMDKRSRRAGSSLSDKIAPCKNLVCSRRCNFELSILDFLECLDYLAKLPGGSDALWESPEMRSLMLTFLDQVADFHAESFQEVVPYLCLLLRMLSERNAEGNFIVQVLDRLRLQMNRDQDLLVFLLWEIRYLAQDRRAGTRNFVATVESYLRQHLDSRLKRMAEQTVQVLSVINQDISVVSHLLPVLFPFDLRYQVVRLLSVKMIKSNSRPLLLEVLLERREPEGHPGQPREKVAHLLVKHDPNLRKEQTVSALVCVLHRKLCLQAGRRRLNPFEETPCYHICMLTRETGVIEFVEDSITLRQINLKNFTLQNYILEKNRGQPVSEVKDRFMQSLAISSSLSFILGLGDRHLDNIMITSRGQIFHIDFGYLLENPMTNVLGSPVIKITSEMIDFLGGVQSLGYQAFKQYVIEVFDLLRLENTLVTNYYFMMHYDQLIPDWASFRHKLAGRFMNGMSCKEVEISLINEIEASSNSYSSALIDIFHHLRWKS